MKKLDISEEEQYAAADFIKFLEDVKVDFGLYLEIQEKWNALDTVSKIIVAQSHLKQ